METDPRTVEFLSKDPVWRRGFGTGYTYALMLQQLPIIIGTFNATETEQLFLMAHRMGYSFEWKTIGPDICAIEFSLLERSHAE